jgi:GST-like protein
MAIYPWIVPHRKQGQNLDDFAHLKRWFEVIRERPATQRAYALVEKINPAPVVDEAAKKVLFGQDASTVRQN